MLKIVLPPEETGIESSDDTKVVVDEMKTESSQLKLKD
jgi:hypothetical protein